MAVPGFEPGSSGSQPLMLTTTLYHHGWEGRGGLVIKEAPFRSDHKFTNTLGRGGDSATSRHAIALIAQLGER